MRSTQEKLPMSVFDTIRTMLAVREYDGRPIPEETVQRIVEAGRLTGSSMNGQPWHFVVVQDPETLRQIGALSPYGPYIAQAPLAIAIVLDDSRYAVSDASRAAQDMLLTAWDEGIGGNWVGFGGMPEIKDLLGIPADKELLAILPFGYPARPVGKGKKRRKPLSEVAYRERWGEPFASRVAGTNARSLVRQAAA
jgi:nitroreductase